MSKTEHDTDYSINNGTGDWLVMLDRTARETRVQQPAYIPSRSKLCSMNTAI